MSTRCAIARVNIFLMLACGCNGVLFAQSQESKAEVLEGAVDAVDAVDAAGAMDNEDTGDSADANAKAKMAAKQLPESALVIQYSSVFDDYVAFDDIPDIGWKEANDNVGEIGGWRAYARIVQEEARKEAEQENLQKEGDK